MPRSKRGSLERCIIVSWPQLESLARKYSQFEHSNGPPAGPSYPVPGSPLIAAWSTFTENIPQNASTPQDEIHCSRVRAPPSPLLRRRRVHLDRIKAKLATRIAAQLVRALGFGDSQVRCREHWALKKPVAVIPDQLRQGETPPTPICSPRSQLSGATRQAGAPVLPACKSENAESPHNRIQLSCDPFPTQLSPAASTPGEGRTHLSGSG